MNTKLGDQCNKMSYRQMYDFYSNWTFFGLMDEYFFDPLTPTERASRVNEGYIGNKSIDKIIKWEYPLNRLFYRVHDHIRVVNEALAGVFTTDNPEFRLIMKEFLKEYMLGEIYILHSPKFRDFEISEVARLAKIENSDPIDRVQRALPESSFRLLKRAKTAEGKDTWTAVLSNLTNLNIESFLKKGKTFISPLRFSFNEGFMFIRLLEIYYKYEVELQIYDKLLMALSTVGEITAEDQNAVDNKVKQIQCPEVFSSTLSGEDSTATTIEDLKLVDKMQNLTEFYQQIRMELLDRLGELGLGVDDTNKKERITVGENTRALQPTLNFQNSIMNELKNVSYRIQKAFGQNIEFYNKSEESEMRMGGLNQSKFNKYNNGNDKN